MPEYRHCTLFHTAFHYLRSKRCIHGFIIWKRSNRIMGARRHFCKGASSKKDPHKKKISPPHEERGLHIAKKRCSHGEKAPNMDVHRNFRRMGQAQKGPP